MIISEGQDYRRFSSSIIYIMLDYYEFTLFFAITKALLKMSSSILLQANFS